MHLWEISIFSLDNVIVRPTKIMNLGSVFALLVRYRIEFSTYFTQSKPQRYRPRLFTQVGHQTMYAFMGNKHFFTKQCHRQTYQNYEQSRKKLGTFLENKVHAPS